MSLKILLNAFWSILNWPVVCDFFNLQHYSSLKFVKHMIDLHQEHSGGSWARKLTISYFRHPNSFNYCVSEIFWIFFPERINFTTKIHHLGIFKLYCTWHLYMNSWMGYKRKFQFVLKRPLVELVGWGMIVLWSMDCGNQARFFLEDFRELMLSSRITRWRWLWKLCISFLYECTQGSDA